jgi:uncharacterized protein HemY
MFSEHHIHIEKLTESINRLAAAIESRAGEQQTKVILDRIAEMEQKIMATQADIEAALSKIDVATTKTAANIQIVADTDQKISDEIDVLLKEVQPGTVVTDEQVTRLQSFADRMQANSDALDAQVPVLQAIAAKGAGNPVPVPVPPAPTP